MSSTVDNLDKHESLLNELAGLYETTGDEAFKLLVDRTFNQILSGMTKRSKDNTTVVERTNALLNRMVSLNVEGEGLVRLQHGDANCYA
jgi:hypothetical protein